MADDKQSVFFNVLKALKRGRKDLRTGITPSGRGVITGVQIPTPTSNTIQQKQQDFMDVQSVKIAHDLYSRSVYYDADRVSAYQDYRAMDLSPEVSAALDIISDECLEASTVIPLLNGQKKTVEELYLEKNKNFWVYSYNTKNCQIEPAICEKVVYKGEQDVFEVIFDDDSSIMSTDEHLWLLKDNKEYIKTKDLKKGDSIQPFYNRISDKNDNEMLSEDSGNFANSINHSIKEIRFIGKRKTYDLVNVGEQYNYAVLTSNETGVFCHNCMSRGERGNILSIYSQNARIKKVLHDLFHNVLNIDYNLGIWARELLKYGDNFIKLEIDQELGIYDVRQLPVMEVHREEGWDGNVNSARFRWDTNNMYFEEWQVGHFRLLGDGSRLPYGRCLKWDTYVETDDGFKFIKDIKRGDIVYSFDLKTQEKVKSNVIDVVNSGKKEIYKIRTKNNEIESSVEHNFLIYNKTTEEFEYKNVNQLNVGDLFVINKQTLTNDSIKIDKDFPETINKNGYRKNVNLVPDFVDEDFAKLYGFLLGDGWLHNNTVQIALGVDSSLNEKYINLLEKFSGKKIKLKKDFYKKSKLEFSQAWVNSKMLKEIFINNGFFGRAHQKRLPKWIFNAPPNVQKAMIDGLIDADGSINIDKWNCRRYSLELTSEYLVKDVKCLLQRLGIKTGKISSRQRDPEKGKIWDVVYPKKRSYYFYFYDSKIIQTEKHNYLNNKDKNFIITPIIAIEKQFEKFETFDIYVDNENHNFYANGIIVHNSILEPARKLWKQLQLSEDALLVYRISRAPDRRVYYLEVGNIDPADIPQYILKIQNQLKKTPVVDQKTGNINYKFNFQPVWKETPIPLLDGRTLTIEELAKEYESGKQNYVYSVQDKTHQVVPGKVEWCGKNYTAEKLTKVWLDDNTWILTAPEHPFVLRDGSAVRADELKSGDSLMPYYEDKSLVYKKSLYKTVYNPNTGKYEFVHRLIGKEIAKEKEYYNTIHHKDFQKENNSPENLQWVDFEEHKKMHSDAVKKMWKNPETRKRILELMSENTKKLWENPEYRRYNVQKITEKIRKMWDNGELEHMRESSRQNIIKYNKSEEKIQRVIECNKERNSVQHISWYNDSDLHKEHNEIRRNGMINMWNDVVKREEIVKLMKIQVNEKCFQIIIDEIKKHTEFISAEEFLKSLLNSELHQELLFLNKDTKRANHIDKFFNAKKNLRNILRLNGIDNYKEFLRICNPDLLKKKTEKYRNLRIEWNKNNIIKNKQGKFEYKNHKVLRTEEVIMKDDVYCMTVVGLNGENDRHNFALYSFNDNGECSKSGVFVRNSYEEDIFIPIRGDKSSRVETLPGACLALDTKIELLDGRSLELQEIIKEYEQGKELFTYSINPKTGEIVQGEITWAGITRKDADVIKITLDNGEAITVTPDHKFPTRFNGVKQAKDLEIGESLWSFNKKEHLIYNHCSGEWINREELFDNRFETLNCLEVEKEIQTEYFNHKIISVELLSEKQDTGTLTIDGQEKYHDFHNFALSIGVFTQNSNLDQIADVEYLQNKLFAALKVPKPYLNYSETMPGGSTLSQVDLRFSRTVNRYQEALLIELRRIANIHLYFLGFEDDLDNFDLKLANPSTQQELLKLETIKARMEVFKEMFTSDATSPVSYTWAMEFILGFSKHEIKQILRQKKIERKVFSEIEGAVDEYTETGLFYDLDKKFRREGFVPTASKPKEGEEGIGGGGSEGGFGGGSVLPGLGSGAIGGGLETGGGETGLEAGIAPESTGGAPETTTPEATTPEAGGGGGEETEELKEGNKLLTKNKAVNAKIRRLLESFDRTLNRLDEENQKNSKEKSDNN